MRIFITGDCHGEFGKLQKFTDKTKYNSDDYVIILGDFGFVWYNNDDKEHQLNTKALAPFSRCNCTFIVVGGNHENYNAIESFYPIKEFNGARARYIRDNIVWIERGEVFTLNGKKFWCFGGAYSIDKQYRKENKTWWEREQANDEEMNYGLDTVKCAPDYILTHDCPHYIGYLVNNYGIYPNKTVSYFDQVQYELDVIKCCPQWYFGHHHKDDWHYKNFHCMYKKVKEITENVF